MTALLDLLRERVASALGAGRSFALYHSPNEAQLSWIEAEPHDVEVMETLEELDGAEGFVLAPFRVSERSPILLWAGAEAEHIPLEDLGQLKIVPLPEHGAEPSEAYADGFARFKTALGAGRLEKLVLTRAEEVAVPEGFSMLGSFLTACRAYPEAFSYLAYTPLSGIWMGSTPELLLGGSASGWHTMALAGTQALEADALPSEWSAKNLHEHECVVRHIREVLEGEATDVQEHEPETLRAGQVAHLRTRFDFSLPDSSALGSWLAGMHPTPAVSGLPQAVAYDYINRSEGYDRRYYTGFVGYLSPAEGRTDLFVNLRCMQITASALVLYAGGGIMKDSTLREEWQETERKLSTMKQILRPQPLP